MIIAVTIAMWVYMSKFLEIEMNYYLENIKYNYIRIENMEREDAPLEKIEAELTFNNMYRCYVTNVSADSVIYGRKWKDKYDDIEFFGRVHNTIDESGLQKSWRRACANNRVYYYVLSAIDKQNDRIYWMFIPLRKFLGTYIYIGKYLFIATLVSIIFSLICYFYLIVPKIRRMRNSEARMSADLSLAHDVQMGLVRQNGTEYSDELFSVYGEVRPAREVGGDYFYYMRKNDRLYFCIGDVSDKGAAAAIMMAILTSRIRVATAFEISLMELTKELNNTIEDEGNGMFCTMLIGYVENDKVTYINCGHCSPFVIDSNGTVRKIEMMPNIPLGIDRNYNFTMDVFEFKAGETLYTYTDGIIDAVNYDGEMYGEKRLVESLAKTFDILDEVKKWRGHKHPWDDETELIITRK